MQGAEDRLDLRDVHAGPDEACVGPVDARADLQPPAPLAYQHCDRDQDHAEGGDGEADEEPLTHRNLPGPSPQFRYEPPPVSGGL